MPPSLNLSGMDQVGAVGRWLPALEAAGWEFIEIPVTCAATGRAHGTRFKATDFQILTDAGSPRQNVSRASPPRQ